MKIKPMERIWEKIRPDYWPYSIEYGRESIVWHLYHNANRFANKPAIIYYGREITFKELKDLVWQACGVAKIRSGEGRPGLSGSGNCPQFIISYYGHGPGRHRNCRQSHVYGRELTYVLNDCTAKVVIIEDALFPILQSIRDQVPSVESVIVTSLAEYLPAEPTPSSSSGINC